MHSTGTSSYPASNMGFSWGFSASNNAHSTKDSESKKPGGTASTNFGLEVNNGMTSTVPPTVRNRQKRRYISETSGTGDSHDTTIGDHSTSFKRKSMVSKKRVHNSSNVIGNNVLVTSSSSSSSKISLGDTWSSDSYADVSNSFNHLMIKGQPLPLERSLELADKQQLQKIIQELLLLTPETTQLINSRLSQLPVTKADLLESLEKKLDRVRQNIPYNRAYSNNLTDKLDDYAFDRLKPFVLEFLNCLIDYTLNIIPPRDVNNSNNLHDALAFVDRCTEMVLLLPRFELPSNNYYYDKCLEQLSYIWCTLIQHIARDDILSTNARPTLANWYEKLQIYNDKSNNLLQRPLTLFTTLNLVDFVDNTTTTATTTTLGTTRTNPTDLNTGYCYHGNNVVQPAATRNYPLF